jgi:hypothetical protein
MMHPQVRTIYFHLEVLRVFFNQEEMKHTQLSTSECYGAMLLLCLAPQHEDMYGVRRKFNTLQLQQKLGGSDQLYALDKSQ